jgi:hypothetical protein
MAQRLPPESLYRIREPRNFYAAMRSDVKLLHSHRAYVSLTTIIVCCLDALAAGSGRASRGKFETFVEKHFPGLCHALTAVFPGKKKGVEVLYENYRNGFAHMRGPKDRFAIAEDHELGGNWADRIEIEGVGLLVAINVDRLAKEFLELLNQLEVRT